MIGVVSLSLAACGSSGGESTDPTRKSLLDQREKQLTQREASVSQKEKDQAAKDRQQAAKDRELNNRPPRTVATNSIEDILVRKMIRETREDLHTYNPRISAERSQHYTTLLGSPDTDPKYKETQFIQLVPTITSNNVNYTLNFYSGAGMDRLRVGDRWNQSQQDFDEENRLYSVASSALTSTNLDLDLGESFSSKKLTAGIDTDSDNSKDITLHVEVVTDYASNNNEDYVQYGYWLKKPKTIDEEDKYKFGAFAFHYGTDRGERTTIGAALTGTATYKGGMLGMHTSIIGNQIKNERFTGKLTLTSDFGNGTDLGTTTGIINSLKLDERAIPGQINLTIPHISQAYNAGWIGTNFEGEAVASTARFNNLTYTGVYNLMWGGASDPATELPTGIVGTIGGKSGGNSFIASFGAKKAE